MISFFVSSVFGIYLVNLYKKGYRIVFSNSNESSISANILGFLQNQKNIYVEGVVGESKNINPIFSSSFVNGFNSVDSDISYLIFSGLLRKNEESFIPDLALGEPKILEDGKIYEFSLRENVFWHDGEKFTADDVVYTIKTIQSLDTASSDVRAIWEKVEVEKISEFSLRFTLSRKNPDFLQNFTQGIIPKHILENTPAREILFHSFNFNPIGTGPFIFSERKSTDQLILKRNPNFYGEVPEISELHFRFFSSEDDLVKSFEKKEIDGFLSSKKFNFDNFAKREEISGSTNIFLFLNSRNLKEKLREAITYSLSDIFISSGGLNFYPQYEDSVEKSRLALFEFGLKEENGWKWGNGEPFKLRILTLNTDLYISYAKKIQEKLKNEIFVESEIVALSGAEFWDNKVFNRDYDLLVLPIKISKIYPYTFFHSNYSFGINGFNFSAFANKKIDIAIEEYELSSGEKSGDIFEKIKNLELFGIIDKNNFFYYSNSSKKLPKKIFNTNERFFFANSWYVWKKVEIKK